VFRFVTPNDVEELMEILKSEYGLREVIEEMFIGRDKSKSSHTPPLLPPSDYIELDFRRLLYRHCEGNQCLVQVSELGNIGA